MTTINLSEVMGPAARYVAEDDKASIEGLPSAAWEAMKEAVEEHNGAGEPGIECAVAKTHETIADFDAARSARWSEKGSRKEFTFAGMPAVKYDRLQLFRGHARKTVIVIDCGPCRAALTFG